MSSKPSVKNLNLVKVSFDLISSLNIQGQKISVDEVMFLKGMIEAYYPQGGATNVSDTRLRIQILDLIDAMDASRVIKFPTELFEFVKALFSKLDTEGYDKQFMKHVLIFRKVALLADKFS